MISAAYTKNPERQRILAQALNARTLEQIALATQDLDDWVRDHPDDLGIVDAYEMLFTMKSIAEENDDAHESELYLDAAAREKAAA